MVPNVFVIGPMKSGTTWLDGYLRNREEVCLPRGVKETFYFDRNFDKDLNWYEYHFSHYKKEIHQCVIEVAPSYFHSKMAIERICKVNKHIRVVVILRDPIDRSWSHYNHLLKYAYTNKGLKEAVQEFPEVIDASKYSERLFEWMKKIPSDNIYIASFTELKEDENTFCKGICEFLDLEYVSPKNFTINSNQASNPRFMLIVKMARRLSSLLKRKRWYVVVNFLKRLGLKNVVYGYTGKYKSGYASVEETEYLRDKLLQDINNLPNIINCSNQVWLKKYDKLRMDFSAKKN